MRVKNFIEQLHAKNISRGLMLALIWAVFIVGLTSCKWELPIRALEPTPGGSIPILVLEPSAGSVDTVVTIQGEGWPADRAVLVYLTTPDEAELPDYAIANAVVDQEGRFTTAFLLSPQWLWEDQDQVVVTVRADDGTTAAQTNFTLVSAEELTDLPLTAEAPPPEEASATPTPAEPTPTATLVVPIAGPELPPTTSQPAQPQVISIAHLNIRSGPGTTYAIIGLLVPDQMAEVTGISVDGGWWQIKLPAAPDQRGWVSVRYVLAEQTENVPVVYVAAPLPAPVPPPAPPPVIVDWRGEYYDNMYLSGSPVLVRNDPAVNFNWGIGASAASLPADNFSVRWTRTLAFAEGLYRFHAIVDDGLRLYIDDVLLIDSWHDGGWREVSGERWLSAGDHHLRIEYYEHTGSAVVQGWWEQVAAPSPVSGRPEADFDAEPRNGDVPLRVKFDNDSEGNYDDCKWSFGDDDTSRDCDNPRHTYHEAGQYTVKLRVRGPDGEDTKEREDYITVRPVARFTANPRTGLPGLQVYFTNQSTEHHVCEWNFGDGNTSTEDNPIHTYSTAGVYTVRLRVREAGVWSETETKQNYIIVSPAPPANQPPTAVIDGPTTGLVGEPIAFNGSSSSDPDGTISRYAWSFGDGATANGINVSHSYGKVGSYKIILTVTDDKGLSDTSTYTILIEEPRPDQGPVAMINGPASALVGETVIFDSGNSYDPDGAIVSYAWDFGDGSLSKAAEAGESTVAHTYNTPGNYQVTLTVVDNSGLSDTAKHAIKILKEPEANQPPVAVINGPASASVGETVIFDSGGSHDPDGAIVSYYWDFGDRGLSKAAAAGESTVAHTYNTPGDYRVTLTVVDNNGLNDIATHTIAIEAVTANQPPVAVISGPTKGQVKEALTFDGSSSSDPEGMLLSYAWDFNDGGTASGVKVNHSFNAARTYNVILTVTDNGGLKDTTTYTLVIEEPPPLKPEPPTPTPEPPTPTPEPPTPTPEPPTPTPEPPTPTPEPPTPTPEPPTPTPEPPAPTPEPPTPTPEPPTPTPEPPTPTPEPPTPAPEPPPPMPKPTAPPPEAPPPTGEPLPSGPEPSNTGT